MVTDKPDAPSGHEPPHKSEPLQENGEHVAFAMVVPPPQPEQPPVAPVTSSNELESGLVQVKVKVISQPPDGN